MFKYEMMSSKPSATSIPTYEERLEDLINEISSRDISRGRFLWRTKAVENVTWNETERVISASVFGSKKYSVTIAFEDLDASGECDCKARVDCSHVVALIFKAREIKILPAQIPYSATAQPAAEPDSIFGAIPLKFGKKLPNNAMKFLKSADSWWKSRKRTISIIDFSKALGRSTYWRSETHEIYPEQFPPQSAAEYLAYLTQLARKVDMPVPFPIELIVDLDVLIRLENQWNTLKRPRYRNPPSWRIGVHFGPR